MFWIALVIYFDSNFAVLGDVADEEGGAANLGKEGREEGRDDYGGGGRGVGAKTIVQNNVAWKNQKL